jgi:hypothetical protein|nr:MAG TPA: hypothetical protein [Crassvirales sp.]DAT97066.1 MAG TPA: hypothetical protein [Crassvirales sp.]
MKTLKRYACLIGVILLVVTMIALYFTLKSKKETEKRWKEAIANVKSYDNLFNGSKNNDIAFLLTIDQLKYSNDSIFQELNEVRRELKIKDSKLKSLQYISSNFTKSDTIILKDTVFKDERIDIDTLLSDEWYSINVGLRYPSSITVTPKFRSEKAVIVSAKKETVNPPKRFFLFRWFQKKHIVLHVNVIEKNPYIEDQDNRYVEIIK